MNEVELVPLVINKRNLRWKDINGVQYKLPPNFYAQYQGKRVAVITVSYFTNRELKQRGFRINYLDPETLKSVLPKDSKDRTINVNLNIIEESDDSTIKK